MNVYGYICILLCSCIKSRPVVSEKVFSFSIFIFMSPTRSGYKELGLDLGEPLQDQPHKPRRPTMVKEYKYEGAWNPIKIFLEEAIEKQRNTTMDKFA